MEKKKKSKKRSLGVTLQLGVPVPKPAKPRRSWNTDTPFRPGARAAGGIFEDSGALICGSTT